MINLHLKNELMKLKMEELSITVEKMFGLKELNSNMMRVAVE
jgi:hypothetical protein